MATRSTRCAGSTCRAVARSRLSGSSRRRYASSTSARSAAPISWCEDAESRWQLTLECPNCSWLESGVYDRGEVERLEDTLDEGLCTMIADLHRLTQANMAEDIERFISAVHADQVLPEDF